MDSNSGEFWDVRYRSEGPIWGEGPSPTALLALRHAPAGTRVLEVGFGYGRDLAFLGRQQYLVSGIDCSVTGRQLAEERLRHRGVHPEHLWTGSFEDTEFPAPGYDLVVCHRMIHLLLLAEAVERFARKVAEVLRPEGLVCLGARNRRDLSLEDMIQVADNVYEYIHRPGHRIRYWDDETFQQIFGKTFTLLALEPTIEEEAVTHPVPCHLTVMVARKRPTVQPVLSPEAAQSRPLPASALGSLSGCTAALPGQPFPEENRGP